MAQLLDSVRRSSLSRSFRERLREATRRGLPLLVLAAVAGCGASTSLFPPDSTDGGVTDAASAADSAPDGESSVQPDAASEGTAQVQGTVGGVSFTAVTALAGRSKPYIFVHTVLSTEFTLVTITDFQDACGSTDIAGGMLYLSLFQDGTSPESVVTSPDTFDIWLPALDGSAAPPPRAAILNWNTSGPSGGSIVTAQSGAVVISSVSSTHIAGTFDVTFLDGHLTGTFDAPLCADWMRNPSIP